MALDTDDLAPPPKAPRLDLEVMSVEALTTRIGELEAEQMLQLHPQIHTPCSLGLLLAG